MTRWLRRLLGPARALTGRSQLDLELEADGRRRGMSAEESARSARIARGSLTAIRERISDVGWESIVDGLCLDVRCAVRGLRRSPGFTLVATATRLDSTAPVDIAPGASVNVQVVFSGTAGNPGTAAVLTAGGTYTGNSFSFSARVTLP